MLWDKLTKQLKNNPFLLLAYKGPARRCLLSCVPQWTHFLEPTAYPCSLTCLQCSLHQFCDSCQRAHESAGDLTKMQILIQGCGWKTLFLTSSPVTSMLLIWAAGNPECVPALTHTFPRWLQALRRLSKDTSDCIFVFHQIHPKTCNVHVEDLCAAFLGQSQTDQNPLRRTGRNKSHLWMQSSKKINWV